MSAIAYTDDSNDYEDEFGFTVRDEVSLQRWLNHETEGFDEYLHVVPDVEGRRLILYRSVGRDTFPSARLKAVVEDVSFSFNKLDEGHDEPSHWYITSGEAKSLMLFLNSYYHDMGEGLRFTYYEDNGKTMYDGENVGEEALYVRYNGPHGEREGLLNSTHTSELHKMARFKPLENSDE